MIHDPAPFYTRARDPRFFDLGPREEDVERVTIRRGKPARTAPSGLTGDQIGKLAVAGAAVGTAIAFVIDPAGALAALLSIAGL